MNLLELKNTLNQMETISFQLPNGELVPNHFHVTEVGKVSKHFIDCGGTIRQEKMINLQLWNANDYDHRLHPEKLLNILELSEKSLNIENLDIEVEYQGNTIQKFGLDFNGSAFLLTTKQTDCLAKDNCGIPVIKPKVKLEELQNSNSCDPNGGCC